MKSRGCVSVWGLCGLLWASPVGAQPAEAQPAEAQPAEAQAGAQELEVAQIVEGIQRFYAEAADLKADFEQIYTYKVYGRTQRSSGKVFFKKKNKMRWDYQSPEAKLFVSDGATLWVYEPEHAQAFKQNLSSSQLPVALSFMSGEGQLAEEFTAKRLDDPPGGGSYLVALTPKRNAGDYQALHLEVDKRSFAVLASTVLDPVGNTNRVLFKNLATNSGLPDAGFQFKLPAGVHVVKEPGGLK